MLWIDPLAMCIQKPSMSGCVMHSILCVQYTPDAPSRVGTQGGSACLTHTCSRPTWFLSDPLGCFAPEVLSDLPTALEELGAPSSNLTFVLP